MKMKKPEATPPTAAARKHAAPGKKINSVFSPTRFFYSAQIVARRRLELLAFFILILLFLF